MHLHGLYKLLACTQTHTCQEEGYTHLAQHMYALTVGEFGAIPTLLHTQPSGYQCHHQRTAGKT